MDGLRRTILQLGRVLFEPPKQPLPPTPIFDRFCFLFLGIDWIAFGAMHFTAHNFTRDMLPGWVPFPNQVVTLSGIAEITSGVLMFYPRARRMAAWATAILLILYIPAVIRILDEDIADKFFPFEILAVLFRGFLVPHNVFMFLCALHLIQNPYPAQWPQEKPGKAGRPLPHLGRWVFLVAVVLLLCNTAGFVTVWGGAKGDRSTAIMWMLMCLAVGGVLGFLFAVPRANTKVPNQDLLLPNRNIETISDWLTKIIVGLGLVNLKNIGSFITERSEILALTIKSDPNFIVGLIIYFFVSGLLEGYILTRIFLQALFTDSLAKADMRNSPPKT